VNASRARSSVRTVRLRTRRSRCGSCTDSACRSRGGVLRRDDVERSGGATQVGERDEPLVGIEQVAAGFRLRAPAAVAPRRIPPAAAPRSFRTAISSARARSSELARSSSSSRGRSPAAAPSCFPRSPNALAMVASRSEAEQEKRNVGTPPIGIEAMIACGGAVVKSSRGLPKPLPRRPGRSSNQRSFGRGPPRHREGRIGDPVRPPRLDRGDERVCLCPPPGSGSSRLQLAEGDREAELPQLPRPPPSGSPPASARAGPPPPRRRTPGSGWRCGGAGHRSTLRSTRLSPMRSVSFSRSKYSRQGNGELARQPGELP